MSGFSIETSKKHIGEVKEKTEKKKTEVENLEHERDALIETRTEVEGAGLSVEGEENVIKAVNEQRERVSKEAEKESDEIGDALKEIETEVENIQEANENAKREKKKIEDKQAILKRIKMDGTMQKIKSEVDKEIERTEEANKEAMEVRKEAEDLGRRVGNIKT